MPLPTTDMEAQYRLHADLIANGEHPIPKGAVIVEFSSDGPLVSIFGASGPTGARERVGILATAIQALANGVATINSDASH